MPLDDLRHRVARTCTQVAHAAARARALSPTLQVFSLGRRRHASHSPPHEASEAFSPFSSCAFPDGLSAHTRAVSKHRCHRCPLQTKFSPGTRARCAHRILRTFAPAGGGARNQSAARGAAAVWRHLQVHGVSVEAIAAVAVRARALKAEPAVARHLKRLVAHALPHRQGAPAQAAVSADSAGATRPRGMPRRPRPPGARS